ncbi:MAG TPA: hypothetical protein VF624_18100 [Tepidisphaeraceae bacterium]|jgi:hypothetical protein
MSIAIPVSILVEHARRKEDVLYFRVTLDLMGTAVEFASEVRTDFYQEPQFNSHVRDDFGLPPDLRERFAVALYNATLPHLLNGEPMYPDAVTIDDPDLRPWLKATFYHSDVAKLTRLLSANANPAANILLTRRTVTARVD